MAISIGAHLDGNPAPEKAEVVRSPRMICDANNNANTNNDVGFSSGL
jgi:hypothetical protein